MTGYKLLLPTCWLKDEDHSALDLCFPGFQDLGGCSRVTRQR